MTTASKQSLLAFYRNHRHLYALDTPTLITKAIHVTCKLPTTKQLLCTRLHFLTLSARLLPAIAPEQTIAALPLGHP